MNIYVIINLVGGKVILKNLSIEKILKEMEEYGVTLEVIKNWYEDSKKEVSFEDYIRFFYMSDAYIKE